MQTLSTPYKTMPGLISLAFPNKTDLISKRGQASRHIFINIQDALRMTTRKYTHHCRQLFSFPVLVRHFRKLQFISVNEQPSWMFSLSWRVVSYWKVHMVVINGKQECKSAVRMRTGTARIIMQQVIRGFNFRLIECSGRNGWSINQEKQDTQK